MSRKKPDPAPLGEADTATVNPADAASITAAPVPPAAAPAGPLSGDTPQEQTAEGGTGNPAGPATDAMIAEGIAAVGPQQEEVASYLEEKRAEMRGEFPLLAKAIDAWLSNHDEPPVAVRIASARDGFRRAGMAHSREAVDHPVSAFADPAQLEALLAEPTLVVTFI